MKGACLYGEVQGSSRVGSRLNSHNFHAVDFYVCVCVSFLVNRERAFGDGGTEAPEL